MCTCGQAATHVIAKRATLDGVTVALWSDGAITSRMGLYVRHGARTAVAVGLRVAAGWRAMEWATIYDFEEWKAHLDTF